MPISRAFALLALLALPGCIAPGFDTSDPAATWVAVTDAGIVVAGPPGFCVDPEATRSSRDSAFVVMGSCAAIAAQPLLAQPDLPVILTAAVARGAPVSPGALEAYFRTSEGATELATGERVVRTRSRPSGFFVYSVGPQGGRWRGIIPFGGGWLVTVGLRPTGPVMPSEAARFAALDAFASYIVAANRGTRAAAGS